MAGPVEQLSFELAVTGGQQAASDVRRAEKAVDDLNKEMMAARAAGGRATAAYGKASKAATGLGKATGRANKAMKNKRRSMALAANEVTEFLGPMGAAVGIGGQFSSSVQSAGNAAFQLGVAMGPVGIAIGIVVGLLPIIIGELREWMGASDDASDAQERLREHTEAVNRSLREQTTEAKITAASLAALATSDRIADLTRQRREISQGLFESDRDFELRKKQLDLAADQLNARLRNQQENVAALRAVREAEEEAPAAGGGGGRGGGGRRRRGPSEAERLDALMQASMRPDETSKLGGEILSFAEREFTLAEEAQRVEEERAEQQQKRREAWVEIAEQGERAAQAERDRLETARQAVQVAKAQATQAAQLAQINQGVSLAVDSVSTGIQAAIRGEASFLEAFAKTIRARLNGLAIEYTSRSLAALGKGLLTKDPGAFAAAKTYAAAAATAASFAGVAAAVSGGGGGGGGDTGPADAANRDRDGRADEGGQPETIIINFNAPVSEAIQGRQIEQARRAADRRFGGG